ncbi:hypothetical protein PGT21_023853 [Puccinia graminis f. sp. tritici]|uniref:Uncharacterized protein n=1 Tax=Puccinia graminis f. sp. tritici TaxID=56615 RepID=A0A5B0PI85_PUCGR|nr:hypothetical protein PGT21_023853 [Puccinia graminis f. sp. tritici]KAA1100766.1 hypothetical protein PGTUg99_025280 [Puccinia graminis f. sp. tritici]
MGNYNSDQEAVLRNSRPSRLTPGTEGASAIEAKSIPAPANQNVNGFVREIEASSG